LCEKLVMQSSPAFSSLGHCAVAITRRLLPDRSFVAAHRVNETCFTCQRLLTFPCLCVLIMQKTVRSAHAHLADFFAQLTAAWNATRALRPGHSGAKLKHTAFIELNEKAILATVYAPGPAAPTATCREKPRPGADTNSNTTSARPASN